MPALSLPQFLHTLPPLVRPHLPLGLQGIQVNQPFRWIIQFHFGEPRLHYEVSRIAGQPDLELGLHFEAKDLNLNQYLLRGFDHHLLEIQDVLGGQITAEPWDNGWTKVYERYSIAELTAATQAAVGQRLAQFITCLHPFFVELRGEVARVYR
jgi:hypothetical protein